MGLEGIYNKRRPETKDKRLWNRNVSIATEYTQGKSQRDIAKEYNISQAQVSRVLNDKQVKEILDDTQRYYVSKAPEIRERFIALTNDSDKKIQLDAIKEYQKIIGITPSHTQSIFINNLYQDNRQQLISSDVIALLGKHTNTMINDTPLEVERKHQDVVDVSPDNE